jgi:hypothetical protein
MVTSPLRRIIQESSKPLQERRILNALSLAGLALPYIADHSSDTASWVATKSSKGALDTSKFPTEATNWSIAATAGASHAVHMDADGASTRVVCRSGAKLWINFSPNAMGQKYQCRRADYLDIDVYRPSLEGWRAEAMYLEPGMEM